MVMVMTRKISVWLLLLLAFVTTKAQAQHEESIQGLYGVVSAPDGNKIGRVICRLEDANDSLLTYTLTNNQGAYHLPIHPQASKLTFSSIGYDQIVIPLSPNQYCYNVTLSKRMYKLDEVTVTIAPIERHKDTLNYNVGAFIQKEDANIEDVLKRLPGIEVTANGDITYQGKSINKLNIEGMDLMGDKYNQATKNMPASAVSQIQVMENDQPIRALNGAVKNNHATLNIRLKKGYKLKPFGEIEGGIGKGQNCIWANTATAIQVKPKDQLLITGTMDNRGIGLSSLTTDMASNDRLYNNEPLPPLITSDITNVMIPTSPLYYLDNHSYFVGANYLHAFTKYSTIRFNLLYNHERILRNDTLHNQYIANDTISVSQREASRYSSNIAKAQVRYELNLPSIYLEDILTSNTTWNKANAIISANDENIKQDISQRPFTVQNGLNGHIKIGNQILSFSSIARFFNAKEHLELSYNEDEEEKQNTHLSNWFMRHRLMYSFRLWGNTFNMAYILENKHNHLTSDEATTEHESHYWLHTLEPSYTIGFSKGDLTINVPIEYIAYIIKNKAYHQCLVAPSVDLNIKITPSLIGNLAMGYNQDVNTNDLNYKGFLYNNYRTLTVGIDSIDGSNTATANVRLSYLNTFNLLSMNLFLGWSKQSRNYMQDLWYTNVFTLIRPLWMNNNHTSYSASYNIKKAFRAIGLEMSYALRYAWNKRKVSQNDITDNVQYQAISSTLKAEWNKMTWVHLTLTGGYNLHWKAYDLFSASHNKLGDYEYMIKTDLFPCKTIQAYLDYSVIDHEITSSNHAVARFVNCGFKWNINKRLRLKGSIVNLLNTKEYQESSFEGSNYIYYAVPLRGREMMMALNYSF